MKIRGMEKVLDILGYWPDLCDGRIEKVCKADSTFHFVVDYIDVDKDIKCSISFKLYDVVEMSLTDFSKENVVDKVLIEKSEFLKFRIESCFGLNGWITCRDAEVECELVI